MKFVFISFAFALSLLLTAQAKVLEITEQQAASVKLSTSKVKLREGQPTLQFSGVLEADRRKAFRVAPVVDGTVINLHAVAQQRVRKGEVLARLRSNTLGQAQADYLGALARLRLASSERERLQSLWKDGIIAQNRFLEADAEYKSASAILEQNRQHLTLAGLSSKQIDALETSPSRLAEFNLISPANGVVMQSEIVTGQNLAAGETAFQVVDLSTVWVAVRIPVANLPEVNLGAAAKVQVATRGSKPYQGLLQAIDGEVDKESQTISGRIVVKNHDSALRPGMYAQIEITAAPLKHLMVPVSAVFRSGNQAYAFKAAGLRRFEPVAITLGKEAEGWVTVERGLAVGDEVVSSGVAELKSHWQYQGGE